MPLIRIDIIEGQHSNDDISAISRAVHSGLVECFGVPLRDRFQVISEHPTGRLLYDPAYLDIERTDRIVLIQVLFGAGRSEDLKKAFYAHVVDAITRDTGIRRQDVMIALSENTRADWSFGNGVAQYLTMPKEQWK